MLDLFSRIRQRGAAVIRGIGIIERGRAGQQRGPRPQQPEQGHLLFVRLFASGHNGGIVDLRSGGEVVQTAADLVGADYHGMVSPLLGG